MQNNQVEQEGFLLRYCLHCQKFDFVNCSFLYDYSKTQVKLTFLLSLVFVINICQHFFYAEIYACIFYLLYDYDHVYDYRYYRSPTVFCTPLILLVYFVLLYHHYYYCHCFRQKDFNGVMHEVIKIKFQWSQYGLEYKPLPWKIANLLCSQQSRLCWYSPRKRD